MFMNIIVGVMAAVALYAGIWGFVVDHKKEKEDEATTAPDTKKEQH